MSVFTAIAADAPELALLAATIKLALDDARCGDPEAREWLAGDECQSMLSWLIPESSKLDSVHAALLARLRPRKPWQSRLRL